MSSSLKNSDTRPLPEGWTEHFDSEYYVDLVPEPPRVTFIHPCDLEGKHPTSAPANSREHPSKQRLSQRPVGPRKSSTASLNPALHDTTQRQRRATVAQQLYASSLNPGSRQLLLTPDPPPHHQQSVSSSPGPEDVASSSSTYSSRKNPVSSTSSSLLNLDHHDPRKVFDCTRMAPGVRRMTVNGTGLPRNLAPGSSPRDGKGYGAHELYHPSVSNVTPSPVPPKDTPDNHPRGSALPMLTTQDTRLIGSSSSQSETLSLAARGAESAPDVMSPLDSDIYSGVTEDGLLVAPGKPSVFTPSKSSATLDVSSLKGKRPESSSLSQASAKMSSTDTGILQPKPIRPMQGVSLNLQVQAAVMAETREDDSTKHPKSTRKSQLLKNFSLGISKGKTKVLIDPYPEDASSYGDSLTSKFDESFVLVNTN
ncbi:hypothetical protein CPB84DRAFT_1742327 [Gymnopilus junonius]|uniref:Uncharacterized protein n=1 Tax=Gymnopilus junonius TaxID=109634 RepID=A0A9P5P1P8_GYMJU|nr:hypothetical protein CPB84DRAFT_1742327 [Gymnopilus junonius]